MDVKKGDPSFNVGVIANWCGHSEKSLWIILKNLKINLLYNPVVPFLGMSPKDSIVYFTNTCSTVFIPILLIVASKGNIDDLQLTDGKQKMWYIYTKECY